MQAPTHVSAGSVSHRILLLRSLGVELVEELAARALCAFLASSPSVTNACLARIPVHLAE